MFSDPGRAILDGLTVLRGVRGRWPDVVVLVTEHRMRYEAAEATASGDYDDWVDPFSVEQV